MSGSFLDTNIILYLYSVDEERKREIALNLVNQKVALISTQVLNEVANVLLRKFAISEIQVEEVLRELSDGIETVRVSVEIILSAVKLKKRYGFSYFDSLMLSSALDAGCDKIYSEDMQHG